jgi:hypothetical protein
MKEYPITFTADMKEYPITFTAAKVRAILDGRKTQFRRLIKPQPDCRSYDGPPKLDSFGTFSYPAGACGRWTCPYGQPGDRMWVRETFALTQYGEPVYRADAKDKSGHRWTSIVPGDPQREVRWTSSTQMPRKHSRIWLENQSVRVERLRDITRGDAMAEGCPFPNMQKGPDPRVWFATQWSQSPLHENPWVWVVDCRVTSNT